MKYIHIVQFHLMSGGGVGSVISDLCEAMARESSEVYVISLFRRDGVDVESERKWASQYGIHVLLMQECPTDSTVTVIRKLRETLLYLSKDSKCCLYLHLKWGVLAGVLCSLRLNNVRRVEVYHSGYLRYKLQSFVCKPFINKYISVSNDAKQQLEKWFKIKPGKIGVVYNGVDVDQIRKYAQTSTRTSSCIAFLSVGRLSYEKGFITSISAYSDLCASGKLVDTSYTMIGQGPQMEDAICAANGLVTFTGVIPRESVFPNIANCDVMVLPSLWEGNSILLLETLCIGKPLIVSDIPSFREVLGFKPLSDDENYRIESFGAVFKASNIESCAICMYQMSRHKSDFDDMSKWVSRLANNYSINNQARRYFDVASEVFGE